MKTPVFIYREFKSNQEIHDAVDDNKYIFGILYPFVEYVINNDELSMDDEVPCFNFVCFGGIEVDVAMSKRASIAISKKMLTYYASIEEYEKCANIVKLQRKLLEYVNSANH
ncbi:MAG: hypothetical protein WC979_00305 [Candidatus Pacearchaeota archaeon]|jgi:hypothetical protein|nr:hypothetical protein [Clostridia bacterium]